VNRFPTWKYALIALVIAAAFLYTLPNFFGEAPAVQVSTGKSTVKIDPALVARVEETLKKAMCHSMACSSTSTACACASRIPTPSCARRT